MTPAFEPLHDPVDAEHERVFLVHRDRVLVSVVGDGMAVALSRHQAEAVTAEAPKVVLGRLGNTLYWASELPDPDAAPDALRHLIPDAVPSGLPVHEFDFDLPPESIAAEPICS